MGKKAGGRRSPFCSLVLFLAALVASVSGCTTLKITYRDPAPPEPKSFRSVELFRAEPIRPYKVVARFRFADRGWNFSRDQLERRIRKEAAGLGGDGVIVEERVQGHFVAEGLLIGHTAQVSERVVSAKVVVFTAGP